MIWALLHPFPVLVELGGGLIALFRPRIHHRTVPMCCWGIDRATTTWSDIYLGLLAHFFYTFSLSAMSNWIAHFFYTRADSVFFAMFYSWAHFFYTIVCFFYLGTICTIFLRLFPFCYVLWNSTFFLHQVSMFFIY